MIKKIFYTQIPSWFLIVIIFLVGAMSAIFFLYFSDVVYNYKLFLPGGVSGSVFEYGPWPALENAKFFSDVKNRFIAEKADFIESDLSSMVLRVYKAGQLAKEVKIVSKGKEGSWWETPAGIYRIQGKEKNHFSSFGQVYMPWSMPFQGNFFIHGWPYYEGGESVAEGYSGGCIRLKTEDAKEVFDLAQAGMPILVFDNDFSQDDFKYEFRAPRVSAESYLAADLKSNFVFVEKGSKEIRPIASITKLVTALVATEYINLERKLYVAGEDLVSTSKPRLKVGQGISVYNLLYPLLLESSNEAAAVFSRSLGDEYFVKLMNDKAAAFGMKNTKFVDAAGSLEGNQSTAQDLFTLAKYLYNNRSFILNFTAGKVNTATYGRSIFADLDNFNIFTADENFVGGKVGKTTAAKETIISVFDIPVGGEKRPIVVIALGSDNVEADARAILEYVHLNFGL